MGKLNEKKLATTLSDNDCIVLTLSDGAIARIKKNDLLSLIKADIKIGGRNYLILSRVSSYALYNTIPTYSGNTITTQLLRANSGGINLAISVSGYTVTAGDIYTISGIMKINGNPVTKAMWLNKTATTYSFPITFDVNDNTGRFEATTKYTVASAWLLHTTIQGEVGDTITIEGLKFEKGNIATDWTPAVEEMINS